MIDIEKEIERRNKRKEARIYKFKGLETKYIIFYPLMVIAYYYEWIKDKNFKRLAWNEKRTKKILDYAFFKIAEISENGDIISYWFSDYRFYWGDVVKFYDKKYCRKFKTKISDYLFNHYEINGYNKEVIREYEWTKVVFTKI